MNAKKQTTSSAGGLQVRRILVPIDFSDNAQKALRYAISLANRFGARITLLHVIKQVVYPTEMGIMMTNGLFAATALRKRLAELAQKFVPESVRGKTLVRGGEPWDEIAAVARQTKADLIVCTTHGYTGLKHVVLGSTAERVVRHAPCPVLTVRSRGA